MKPCVISQVWGPTQLFLITVTCFLHGNSVSENILSIAQTWAECWLMSFLKSLFVCFMKITSDPPLHGGSHLCLTQHHFLPDIFTFLKISHSLFSVLTNWAGWIPTGTNRVTWLWECCALIGLLFSLEGGGRVWSRCVEAAVFRRVSKRETITALGISSR